MVRVSAHPSGDERSSVSGSESRARLKRGVSTEARHWRAPPRALAFCSKPAICRVAEISEKTLEICKNSKHDFQTVSDRTSCEGST